MKIRKTTHPTGTGAAPVLRSPKPIHFHARVLATLLLLGLAVLPAGAAWSITSTTTLGEPAPGVRVIETRCRNATATATVTAICFNAKTHTFRVIDSPSPGEATLANTLAHAGAIAGINGGYFHKDYRAVGLVIAGGKTLHPFERAKLLSGIVGVRPNGLVSIIRSSATNAQTTPFRQALQCGPMLVEDAAPVPGLNADRIARRTAAATGQKGAVALIYISSVTLSDAGHILALPNVLGTWAPETALNLDGGTSSGLWAGKTTSLPEIKRVRNFLAVFPK